jgi:hypothetical protein
MTPTSSGAPIALDGIAYGIDYLDAILVLHLGDAHVHAAWVRPGSTLAPGDLSPLLRDAYRASELASLRIEGRRDELNRPVITLELPGPKGHTVLLRRVRSHVVACVFDAAMPLGMARLIAAALAASIEPELPRTDDQIELPARTRIREEHIEREPTTLSFGATRSRRALPPQPRPTGSELERTRRMLAYYEAHAPEPHVARHRLALRAGLTLIALDHPEALAPEAMMLLETAAEDILGLDRAQLRRIS